MGIFSFSSSFISFFGNWLREITDDVPKKGKKKEKGRDEDPIFFPILAQASLY